MESKLTYENLVPGHEEREILDKSFNDKLVKEQTKASSESNERTGRTGRTDGTLLSFVPFIDSLKEYSDVVDSYSDTETYKNKDKEATKQKYEEKIKEIRAANKAKKEGK